MSPRLAIRLTQKQLFYITIHQLCYFLQQSQYLILMTLLSTDPKAPHTFNDNYNLPEFLQCTKWNDKVLTASCTSWPSQAVLKRTSKIFGCISFLELPQGMWLTPWVYVDPSGSYSVYGKILQIPLLPQDHKLRQSHVLFIHTSASASDFPCNSALPSSNCPPNCHQCHLFNLNLDAVLSYLYTPDAYLLPPTVQSPSPLPGTITRVHTSFHPISQHFY